VFKVLDADVSALPDGELDDLLLAAQVERNRFDAAELRALAVWDARQAWAADGCTSAAVWLRNRRGCSGSTARERLRVARRLRHMPLVTAAFEAGRLSYEKVRLLTNARTDTPEIAAVFAESEPMLVDQAMALDGDQFAGVVRYWRFMVDAAGLGGDAKAQRDRCGLWLSETFDGMFKLDGLVDPETGHIVKAALETIMDELYRAARADSGADSGDEPATRLSPSRCRADALAELARRATASDSMTSRPARPTVSVTLPIETLQAESGGVAWFDDGTPLTGEAARRLACDANITRVITNGHSEILDLGRLTPVPSAAQRRAVILRDGACTFAGCDTPPGRCQVHHIVHYGRGRDTGGPTDLANLTLVCCRHHHLIHEGGYQLTRNPISGQIETRRPDGTPIPTRPRAGPLNPIPPVDRAPNPGPNRRGPHHPRDEALALGTDPDADHTIRRSSSKPSEHGPDLRDDEPGRDDATTASDQSRSPAAGQPSTASGNGETPAGSCAGDGRRDLSPTSGSDLSADGNRDLDWNRHSDQSQFQDSDLESAWGSDQSQFQDSDLEWARDWEHRPGCEGDARPGS
jgi:hypothetical protein